MSTMHSRSPVPPPMGTADAEIKVPVAENPELSLVPSFTPRVDHSIYIYSFCMMPLLPLKQFQRR